MANVLVVDSDAAALESAQSALASAGHEVASAKTCDLARELLAEAKPEALVVDFGMGAGSAGVGLIREVRASDSAVAIVLMTAIETDGWDRSLDGAEQLFDVDALVDKPVEGRVLTAVLDHVLAATGERRSHAAASPHFAAILSRAIANEHLSEQFYRVAAEGAQTEEARAVLLQLAEDELGHAELLQSVSAGDRTLPVPEGAPGAGLLASLSGPALSTDLSPKEAFVLAMEKEKAAAEFYRSWASLAGDGPDRDLLLRLAGMEEGHRERLERLYMESAYPEAW